MIHQNITVVNLSKVIQSFIKLRIFHKFKKKGKIGRFKVVKVKNPLTIINILRLSISLPGSAFSLC
jgi:hypothetical protein